jgi:hypothetical protein
MKSKLRSAGTVARIGEMRNVYESSVGKLKGKRPLGRLGRWREDIRIDLKRNVGRLWSGYVWIRIGTSGGVLWTQ